MMRSINRDESFITNTQALVLLLLLLLSGVSFNVKVCCTLHH